MSHNNWTLLNGVLTPKLLNNPFASCSFINLDFLLLHTGYFDYNIGVHFLFSKNFKSAFSVCLLHFKQYVSLFYKIPFIKNLEIIISHSLLDIFLWINALLAIQSAHFDLPLIFILIYIYIFSSYIISVFSKPEQ